MGVWSVGGIPLVTVIRKTVMLSMVEMPRVIFSPDSAGIRNTNLEDKCDFILVLKSKMSHLQATRKTDRARMLMSTAGWM